MFTKQEEVSAFRVRPRDCAASRERRNAGRRVTSACSSAVLVFGAILSAFAAPEDFPCRSGKFVVVASTVTPAKGMNLGGDTIASFDISATIRNETREAWKSARFDVDVFQPDGSRIGEGISPHSFFLDVAIGAGEEKLFRVNRARGVPHPVTMGKFRIALSEDSARAILVDSGSSVGLLAADTKCAAELKEAMSLQGLEGRKKLAELVTYKCITTYDSPIHAVEIGRDETWAQVRIIEGPASGKSGWVPSVRIKP